jgi:protein arginine kinase
VKPRPTPERGPGGRSGAGWPLVRIDQGTEWLRGDGAAADVVMSSRVRLARNLAGFPFMSKASRVQRLQVLDQCRDCILRAGLAGQMAWVNLHEAGAQDRTLLVERHLTSQQHARGRQSTGAGGVEEPRGVAISVPDERLSIMVNEEDHLRIQCIRAGLSLDAALVEIDAVDDKLEACVDYAYSARFGYLTACPTNVGTGVRLSVMLHLPGLKLAGDIEKVKRAATDMALAVRGFYGEGSEAAGDFYQISNQTTLGKTEQVLLHELQNEILPRVIEYERAARQKLLTKRRSVLEDQAFRALGALTHARLMSTEESMQLLSQVRLGAVMGLLPGVNPGVVNGLMLLTQPAHLQRVVGQELTQDQRRGARAALLRARLNPKPPEPPA